MSATETPRTDNEADHVLKWHNDFVVAEHFKRKSVAMLVSADFARTLERETIDLAKRLEYYADAQKQDNDTIVELKAKLETAETNVTNMQLDINEWCRKFHETLERALAAEAKVSELEDRALIAEARGHNLHAKWREAEASAAKAREDTKRLDFLERELEREKEPTNSVWSLFRRNELITRATIDDAMRGWNECSELEELREQAARVCERHMGPIETYNPGYRKWMQAAAEIRSLPLAPLAPEVQEAVELAKGKPHDR